MRKYWLLFILLLTLPLMRPFCANATVLSVFKRDSGGYILTPPTFTRETPYAPANDREIYINFFNPKVGVWSGNLKRYNLPREGLAELLDQDGKISVRVFSTWGTSFAGNDFDKGGLAEVMNKKYLIGAQRRNVYTYLENISGGTPSNDLTLVQNRFASINQRLTAQMLNVSEKIRTQFINDVRQRELGAIIHSRPLKVFYPELNQSFVFIGDNSGFLHCINDLDGDDLWSFIAPEHIGRLKSADKPLDVSFVDNSPILYNGPHNQKVLIYGLGRGGRTYIALDITDVERPLMMYMVKRDILGSPLLGLSTGKPVIKKIAGGIKAGGTVKNKATCNFKDTKLQYDNLHDVMILPGGYDVFSSATTDTQEAGQRGMAIVGVNPLTGKPDPAFALLNGDASPIMRHAVVEIETYGGDGGALETLYFGDMGGALFCAMQYRPQPTGFICPVEVNANLTTINYLAADQFYPYKMFQSGPGQKILFKPHILKYYADTYVFFGTGDREHPMETKVANKFYALRNNNWQYFTYDDDEPRHLTENDLADITANMAQEGNKAEKALAMEEIKSKKGWMLRLDVGEKVIGSPVYHDGVVYFTTYTPPHKQNPLHIARLYALDHETGGAAFLWNPVDDNSGRLTKEQRSKIIGYTMPSAVEITIFKNRMVLYVTVGTKIIEREISRETLKPFYWREFY